MSKALKISIVCHNLSINSVGRSYIIAKALQRYYKVEIIGPASSGEVWKPIQHDHTITYKTITTKNPLSAAKVIDGDIILACKTRGPSFGYGIIARRLKYRPLILDIDDWDWAFFSDSPLKYKLYELAHFWDINNGFYTWLLEKFVSMADTKLVSNTFLQQKFGGILIPHFRDTDQFNPTKYDGNAFKRELGLQTKQVVLFLGTPRKHKGILDLITAIEKLDRDDVTLLIVGATDADMKGLPAKPFLKVMGQQPFNIIPKFLAAADIVTIFQSSAKSSQGQLPAKVFDAMSMAKPIIASRVSDLPKVLKGCGILVSPGDTTELARKVDQLLSDPKRAKELGRDARVKCVQEYSYDAIAPMLHAVVEEELAKARQTAKT